MQHLWDKIKAYLTSKFGSGTLFVGSNNIINLNAQVSMGIESYYFDGFEKEYAIKTQNGIVLFTNVPSGYITLKNQTDGTAKCMFIRDKGTSSIAIESITVLSGETRMTSIGSSNTYSSVFMFW